MNLRQIGCGLSSLNIATLIRAFRFGAADALDRGRRAYSAIDPLGKGESFEGLQRIPVISLADLIGPSLPTSSNGQFDVSIDAFYTHADGTLILEELIALLAVAKLMSPRGVLEIGTFFGSTTLALAKTLPEATIHTIDLPPDFAAAADNASNDRGGLPMDDFHLIQSRRVGHCFASTPQAGRIVQHLGNTADYPFDTIPDALSFFFVDGSHTYEFAKNDTLRCMAVASGISTMMWHDTNASHPDVLQWINEMRDTGLDVRRIDRTSLAHLRFTHDDPQIRLLIAKYGVRA